MSAAIDVNPLLYASDSSSQFHDAALAFVERVAAGPELVYVFWPVLLAVADEVAPSRLPEAGSHPARQSCRRDTVFPETPFREREFG